MDAAPIDSDATAETRALHRNLAALGGSHHHVLVGWLDRFVAFVPDRSR